MNSNFFLIFKVIGSRLFLIIVFTIVLFGPFYYFFHYKRHFISNEDSTKHITVWRQFGGECYIIPGKYRSVFEPNSNYIKTLNKSYFYVVWNPLEKSENISLYIGSSKVDKHNLDNAVEVIDSQNDFFYKFSGEYYDPTKSIEFNSDSIVYKKSKFEMKYVDIACEQTIFKVLPCPDR